MAKYKNREVTIESYPTEQYTVVVVNEDGTKETVPLSQVNLNKQEAMEFLKLENIKLKNKKELDEKEQVKHDRRDKHLQKVREEAAKEQVKRDKEAGVVPEEVTSEPTVVSMNPFSRKATV